MNIARRPYGAWKEQREFQEFPVRLRKAKDKAEFDQFMAERRTPSDASSGQGSDQKP